jgi:hypothetical protein
MTRSDLVKAVGMPHRGGGRAGSRVKTALSRPAAARPHETFIYISEDRHDKVKQNILENCIGSASAPEDTWFCPGKEEQWGARIVRMGVSTLSISPSFSISIVKCVGRDRG